MTRVLTLQIVATSSLVQSNNGMTATGMSNGSNEYCEPPMISFSLSSIESDFSDDFKILIVPGLFLFDDSIELSSLPEISIIVRVEPFLLDNSIMVGRN